MFPIKQYYPNFLKHRELAPWSEVLSIHYSDCSEWYYSFLNRIIIAIKNREYLPIYRLSHGEYILAVGHKMHHSASLLERLKYGYLQIQRLLGLRPLFYSGSPDNSYEEFSRRDIAEARRIYIDGLREVEVHGMFAVSFYLNKGFQEYITPYRKWLDTMGVKLTKDNYFSFYMVYCLLAGPDAWIIFEKKRIAVVSSFTSAKIMGLEEAFKKRGVQEHYFINVSPNKAIFDKIDTSSIPFSPDLILVAAGVGSANIILQLKMFKCVIIDSGFALDALAFPEKRWHRPFCIPDEEFDRRRIKFLPKEKTQFEGPSI
jgi:hypothetical protein